MRPPHQRVTIVSVHFLVNGQPQLVVRSKTMLSFTHILPSKIRPASRHSVQDAYEEYEQYERQVEIYSRIRLSLIHI